MKGILSFAAALAMTAIAASAQEVAPDGSSAQNEVTMRTVGNVEMVVSYRLDQLCDYPNEWRKEDWREEGTLLLEVGGGVAHSYVAEERRKVIEGLRKFKAKNHWWTEIDIHALVGETLIDKGELTQIVNLDAAGIYQYTEAVPKLEWKICDERKAVLGYDCQRAMCSFRGRDYEAWFAADIPVGFGPWKLQGLPGLILEASDTKNEYHFTADGIEKREGVMQLPADNIRPVKRERAMKMEAMLHRDHGAYAADYGITFRLEGMEHDAMPYYPLELK